MRRTLALFSLLTLAACEADHTAARDVLTDRGYTRITLSTPAWTGRACDYSEPFAVDFTASRDGRRWAGTLCAGNEPLQGARLLIEREVGVAPSWDAFSRRELR